VVFLPFVESEYSHVEAFEGRYQYSSDAPSRGATKDPAANATGSNLEPYNHTAPAHSSMGFPVQAWIFTSPWKQMAACDRRRLPP
jgi:hypothetical protein